VGERSVTQQRCQQRVAAVGQRHHQPQVIAIENLVDDSVRMYAQVQTAFLEAIDQILLGQRRAVGEKVVDGGDDLGEVAGTNTRAAY
jgi:hypothetical protein